MESEKQRAKGCNEEVVEEVDCKVLEPQSGIHDVTNMTDRLLDVRGNSGRAQCCTCVSAFIILCKQCAQVCTGKSDSPLRDALLTCATTPNGLSRTQGALYPAVIQREAGSGLAASEDA